MKSISLFRGILVLLLLSACSSPAPKTTPGFPENFGQGKWNELTFRHDYLKLTLTIPEDFTPWSQERLDDLKKMLFGRAKQKGQNADIVDNASLGLRFILGFHVLKGQYEPTGERAPSVIAWVENISPLGITTGREYLDINSKTIRNSENRATVNNIHSPLFGGKKFDGIEASYYQNETRYYERRFAHVEGDFALVFTLTSTIADDFQELEQIVAGMKFD